jgi:hypothetical protein
MGVSEIRKAVYPLIVSKESIQSAFYKLIALLFVYPSENISLKP